MKRIVGGMTLVVVLAALGTLGAGASAASADLGFTQSAALTCSDGTNLPVSLGAAELASLADAVSAINLHPAGEPPLSCSLNQSATPASGGAKDHAVGGGDIVGFCSFFGGTGGLRQHFALSAHVDADTLTSGVGGTFNVSMEATSDCPVYGTLVAKVDCLQVEGNHADMTAVITKSRGNFFTPDFFSPGTEIWIAATDSGNAVVPDTIQASLPPTDEPCSFWPRDYENPVVQGSINVKDAD